MTANREDRTLYTCTGKGGLYEYIGLSDGAGMSTGEQREVYRCTATGRVFHRECSDFSARMEPVTQSAEPVQGEAVALDQRLEAAGMLSVTKLLQGAPIDSFLKHAGVNDIASLLQWAEMRRGEYLRMQARYDLGERDKGDDLYEWVVAHCAVFTELHVNIRAAAKPDADQMPAYRRKEGVMGCKRFMTQRCYDAQPPEMKARYEPFHCANCLEAKPDAELVALLVALSKAAHAREAGYAARMHGGVLNNQCADALVELLPRIDAKLAELQQ